MEGIHGLIEILDYSAQRMAAGFSQARKKLTKAAKYMADGAITAETLEQAGRLVETAGVAELLDSGVKVFSDTKKSIASMFEAA